MRPGKSALRIAAVSVTAGLTLPAPAQAAPEEDKEFDASQGFVDPRLRKLPRTHRFRLALSSNYIRLSSATDDAGNSTRFRFAPVMLDVGYQAQFARYLMARLAVGFGANVANSRHAMPVVLLPKAYFGFQGKLFGLAATYGFMYPFPQTPNATDGRDSSLGQPVISKNHVIGGEASFTTRVDRMALSLAVGGAGVKSVLQHYQLAGPRWYPMLMISFGAYFDGSMIREKRRGTRERPRTSNAMAGR